MNPTAWQIRSWAKRLTLSAVCGMALTSSAYAQFSPPGFSFPPIGVPGTSPAPSNTAQQDQHVGTVLTVPMTDFGTIVAQNVIRQKNVNLLHFSQTAIGDMNTQVATISIRQRNAASPQMWEASKTCWLPTRSLDWVKQANKNTTIIEQGAVGYGNQQVAQVEVDQGNDLVVPKGTHFMMCPVWALDGIRSVNQKNINVAHISQLAIGDNNSQVALVAVDQHNGANLNVPGSAVGPLVQLNFNLTVISQVAVGSNNTQVATVNVGQDNKL